MSCRYPGRAAAYSPAAVDGADLVERDAVAREQAAMHNQHLAVQAVRQRQPAERLPEEVCHDRIVLRFYLHTGRGLDNEGGQANVSASRSQ